MANIQIANLAQIEKQFNELSNLELEGVVGGSGPRVDKGDFNGDGIEDVCRSWYRKNGTIRKMTIKFG
ncbi:hypothetical protein [Trichormus sp. NMC-1]|uniref:hypothetical protein n=1 Tax=Trichormus sp. NMC-1 TaxID=1853259 RepID=UPI0008DBF971|nr:hypothetical protein [Trichormus sp. NMC-1]